MHARFSWVYIMAKIWAVAGWNRMKPQTWPVASAALKTLLLRLHKISPSREPTRLCTRTAAPWLMFTSASQIFAEVANTLIPALNFTIFITQLRSTFIPQLIRVTQLRGFPRARIGFELYNLGQSWAYRRPNTHTPGKAYVGFAGTSWGILLWS